jgi:hypothetical protein
VIVSVAMAPMTNRGARGGQSKSSALKFVIVEFLYQLKSYLDNLSTIQLVPVAAVVIPGCKLGTTPSLMRLFPIQR